MIAITELNKPDHLDLEISPVCHYIIGFLVCLLLFFRVHSGLARSREGRTCVDQMNRNAREFTFLKCMASRRFTWKNLTPPSSFL